TSAKRLHTSRHIARPLAAFALVSEFESGVVAAVVAEVDVVGAGLGEGVVAGGEFVAAGQQFGGFGAVGVVGVVAGGGQVGGGGFDGGGPLAGRVERAEVLGPGQLPGEDVGEGVGGVA